MEIIIGKKAGFCAGVRNAVNKAKEAAEINSEKNIYCLGDLVHNPVIMNNLEKLGLRVINNLNEIENPQGKQVIIRAHGVTKDIYEQAEILGIKLIDLTCPNVLIIHKMVKEYAEKGYYILVIGEKVHPEVIGTASFCGEKHSVISTIEDLEEILHKLKNKEKIFVVAQTTFNLEKFKEFTEKIQKEVQNEVIVKNTICDATKTRQQETIELAKSVDYMIIIGGKKSSNTNKLYQISSQNCKNVIMIEDAAELTEEKIKEIKQFNTIGIMAGASTPQESIEEVQKKLENKEEN